jgi:hypothetical protein
VWFGMWKRRISRSCDKAVENCSPFVGLCDGSNSK